MAIIVDTTNIVQAGFDLGGVSLTLLRELARDRGHRLVMPDVVARELRAKYLERVSADMSAFRGATQRVRRFHPLERVELPESEHVANLWHSLLEAHFEIEEVSGEEARSALFREAAGQAPSVNKHGARDAAIWEVVKRLHLSEQGEIFFVSHNTKDFADPKDEAKLHPDLRTELGDGAPRLRYLHTIDDVLAALGDPLEYELTVAELDEHHPAIAAVMGWVQLHPGRKAVSFWADFDGPPPTAIAVSPNIEALPVAVEATSAYDVEGRKVVVAKTRWQLSYDVVAIPLGDDVGSVNLVGDVSVTLLIRDLPDGGQAAEVVDAQDLTLTVFRSPP